MKKLDYFILFNIILLSTFGFSANNENTRDSLFLALSTTKEDTSRVNILLEIADFYYDKDIKLCGKYAAQALEMSREIEFHQGISNSSFLLSTIYSFSTFDLAEEYIIQAYEIEKQNPNSARLADVYNQIGIINDGLSNNLKALEFFKRSLEISIFLNDSVDIAARYHNIGNEYFYLDQMDSAFYYTFKAIEINEKINYHTHLVNNYGSIANMYRIVDSLDLGWQYLDKAFQLLEENNYTTGIRSWLYNQKGQFLFEENKTSEAIEHFIKAGNQAKDRDDWMTQYNALENLIHVYSEIGNIDKALEYSNQLHQLKDTMWVHTNTQKLDMLEIKYEYEKRKEIIILEHKTKVLRMWLMITGISLLFLVALSLILFLRILVKKNILEREKLEIKKSELEQSLELKNRELTSKIIHLVNINELIEKVIKKLTKSELHFKQENIKPINEIVSELKIHLNKDLWKSFDLEFINVHPEFYLNLEKEFKDLTGREKRLCALLRLNLSSKEISDITHIDAISVDKARTRLRKKLGLTGTDTNLSSFLSKY